MTAQPDAAASAGAVPISAVVIAANAEQTIDTMLASLTGLDEVVVYLNDSSDGTRARAAAHANVTLHDGEFTGFGPTKNAAVAAARNDWVFSIDTDESIDAALAAALAAFRPRSEAVVYETLRKNRFCGRHVARGGWGNDRLVRLFHRGHARFNDKQVHEKVVADAGVELQRLPGVLWHDAVLRVDQFLQKISRYSELAARDRPARAGQHPLLALLRAQFSFFKSYVLQLGLLAGWRGVVIAAARATGTFFKYAKRYSKSRGHEPQ